MENENCQCGQHKHRGGKIILGILVLLCITAVAIVSIIRDRIVNIQQNQISVIGHVKVPYQPDIANVVLGVQVDKVAKAEDALNQLNEKVNKIIIAIKATGVADADIQTQNYSLTSQYDYINNVSVLGGYSANQQLTIKIRDIGVDNNKVSQVISKATTAGANQVNGVSFDVSNLQDLKQQARLLAIADARKKSEVIASALGVRLKEVAGWWENIIQSPDTNQSYPYADGKGGMGGGASSAVPTIPSGGQEIITEVNINYIIK
ncbi:MAG: SIMPL domain-containing protein [bacterium]